MAKYTKRKYANQKSLAKSVYALARAAQGASIQQIAKELDVTEDTARRRLRQEMDDALKSMTNVVADIKVMQTQQYNYIYGQAIQSWQLSAAVDENGSPTQAGDVKYLDSAMKSLKDIRQIWNANRDIEISDEGDLTLVDDTQQLDVDNIEQVLIALADLNVVEGDLNIEELQSHLLPKEVPIKEIDTIEFDKKETPAE